MSYMVLVTAFTVVMSVILPLLTSLLPASPFRSFFIAEELVPYISALNYFLPIHEMILMIELWLPCVLVVFYFSVAKFAISTVTDIVPM